MTVQVRLFALAREIAGTEICSLEIGDQATALDLKNALAERFPTLATALRLSMVAVNADYAAPDRVLQTTDDIALIPPVSGG